MVKYHPVKLVGLNDRAKKIIAHYNNCLLLEEYDEYGRPLNMKDEEPAIFLSSPDMFWHGWFILDKDVRFAEEVKNLSKSIEQNKKITPIL